MNIIVDWVNRTLNNRQVVLLGVCLLATAGVLYFFGDILLPVLASIVIAYLLEGIILRMEKLGLGRRSSVVITFTCFIAMLPLLLIWLMPILTDQLTELVRQMPSFMTKLTDRIKNLYHNYPDVIKPDQLDFIISKAQSEVIAFVQEKFSVWVSGVFGVLGLALNIVLVPIIVFFFLKDKGEILGWLRRFLPKNLGITGEVWHEVNNQISNYIRGKIWEILIVWAVCFVLFQFMGLNYSVLLSLAVGLSCIVPIVGAVLVTIPVLLIAWIQWGWQPEFFWLAALYAIIITIDANVLVPLIFSGAVNLHPVAIIIAVLIFGGLWGFWGVFFAIPLATLVQAILLAWPRAQATAPD